MKDLYCVGDIDDLIIYSGDIDGSVYEESLYEDSRLIIVGDCFVFTTAEYLDIVNTVYPTGKDLNLKDWLVKESEYFLEELFVNFQAQFLEILKICEKVSEELENMSIDEFKNCDLHDVYQKCTEDHLQETIDSQTEKKLNDFNNKAIEMIVSCGGCKIGENEYLLSESKLGKVTITLESEVTSIYSMFLKFEDVEKVSEYYFYVDQNGEISYEEYYPNLCLNILESFLENNANHLINC